MAQHPDNIGYVNSKKGFTSSTRGSITTCYILCTECDSNNDKLYIKTINNSTGKFENIKEIHLDLPYRIMINDPELFDYSIRGANKWVDESDINLFKKYNPGIPTTGGKIDNPFDGSTRYFEFNLTRGQIERVEQYKKDFEICRSSSNFTSPFKVSNYSINIRDTQASLVLQKDFYTTGIDELYISLVSVISLTGDFYNDPAYKFPKTYSWAIPMVFRISIDPTNIVEYITPINYSYIVPSNRFNSDKTTTDYMDTMINASIGGTYTSKLYNYNLIPYTKALTTQSAYEPNSLGCTCDIDLTPDGYIVASSTQIYINSSNKVKIINTIRDIKNISNANLLPMVNNINTSDYSYIVKVGENYPLSSIGKNIIQKINNNYYVVMLEFHDQINLVFYDMNLLNSTKKTIIIPNAFNGSIGVNNEVLYVVYISNNIRYIKKFPTIDSTLINSIDGVLIDTISDINTTNIGSPSPDIDKNLIDIMDNSKTLIYNALASDKTYTKNFVGTTNNIKFFGSNILVVEKVFLPGVYTTKSNQSNKILSHNIGSSTFDPSFLRANTLVSDNSVPFSSDGYQLLKYIPWPNDPTFTIEDYQLPVLSIGTDVKFNYWGAKEQLSSNNNIPMIIHIDDCNGIYSKLDTSDPANWNLKLNPIGIGSPDGGFEIDISKRPDMKFIYYGEKYSLTDYYAIIKNALEISFCDSANNNLIYGSSIQVVDAHIYDYDLTGAFKLYFTINLDFKAAGYDNYEQDGFTIAGTKLTIKFRDYYNAQKAIQQNLACPLFDPPDPVGSITQYNVNTNTISTITKTNNVSNIVYVMNRDAALKSPTYTELTDVYKNIYHINTSSLDPGPVSSYTGGTISNKNIPLSITNRGDYAYVSYSSKLGGIRGGIHNTQYLTNCLEHRYKLTSTTITWSGSIAGYSDDLLDDPDPVLKFTPDLTGNLKVSFTVDHENWDVGSPRDLEYPASGIYPTLKTAYAIVTNNPVELDSKFTQSEFIRAQPNDTAKTYPNVTITWNNFITLYNAQEFKNLITFSPNLVSSSSEIIVPINKTGNYEVYLALADEFDQMSVWCLTNISKNYNI